MTSPTPDEVEAVATAIFLHMFPEYTEFRTDDRLRECYLECATQAITALDSHRGNTGK